MPECFPVKESLFVLLMVKVLLYNTLLHTLSFPDALPTGLEDGIHLGPKPHILGNGAASTLILHFTQDLLFLTLWSGWSFG